MSGLCWTFERITDKELFKFHSHLKRQNLVVFGNKATELLDTIYYHNQTVREITRNSRNTKLYLIKVRQNTV